MLTFTNNAQHMVLTCDICPEVHELDGTFQECVDQAKEDGWKFIKKPDDWYHGCSSECSSKI